MAKWIDISSSVVASTVYSDGVLAAKNPTLTLPSITPITAEIKAGGTIELPITGQVEAMELSITLAGADKGMGALSSLRTHNIEARWVQDVMQSDGTTRCVGCKAFFRAYAKEVGGLSVEVGEASENEFTFGVTRYQLFADGKELWLIDQINDILRVNGVDYAKDLSALL